MLGGNIYVPPNNKEKLHALDKVLESLKSDTTILLGDFNARDTVWDKHAKQNIKLGTILEDLIHRHSLYIATDIDHTYQSTSTIDLTLARGKIIHVLPLYSTL